MADSTPQRMIRVAFERAAALGRPVTCTYCEREVFLDVDARHGTRATGDHWIPKMRGGIGSWTNIVIACNLCNGHKGCLTGEEFMAIRHNPQLCRQRSREIEHSLKPPLVKYANTREKIETKLARHREKLTHRIRIPDPDCERCGGTGLWRKSPRVEYYCNCTLAPIENPDHVNGRKQDLASMEDNACTTSRG